MRSNVELSVPAVASREFLSLLRCSRFYARAPDVCTQEDPHRRSTRASHQRLYLALVGKTPVYQCQRECRKRLTAACKYVAEQGLSSPPCGGGYGDRAVRKVHWSCWARSRPSRAASCWTGTDGLGWGVCKAHTKKTVLRAKHDARLAV